MNKLWILLLIIVLCCFSMKSKTIEKFHPYHDRRNIGKWLYTRPFKEKYLHPYYPYRLYNQYYYRYPQLRAKSGIFPYAGYYHYRSPYSRYYFRFPYKRHPRFNLYNLNYSYGREYHDLYNKLYNQQKDEKPDTKELEKKVNEANAHNGSNYA